VGWGWLRGVDVFSGSHPRVFWLMQAMEGFIKGDDSSENWRTCRQGITSYVVQRRGNKHG